MDVIETVLDNLTTDSGGKWVVDTYDRYVCLSATNSFLPQRKPLYGTSSYCPTSYLNFFVRVTSGTSTRTHVRQKKQDQFPTQQQTTYANEDLFDL